MGVRAWSQKAALLMIAGVLTASLVPATAMAAVVADGGNSQPTEKLLASTANDPAHKAPMWADGAWVKDPSKVTDGVYQWKTTIKGDGAHYGHYDALITFTVKNKVLTAVDLTSQGATFGGKWGTITPKSTNITGFLPKGVSVQAVQDASGGKTVSVGLAGAEQYGGSTVTGITLCTVQDDGTLKTEKKEVYDPSDGDTDIVESVIGYDVADSLKASDSTGNSSQGATTRAGGGGGRPSGPTLATTSSVDATTVNWNHEAQSFTLSADAAAAYNLAKVTYKIGDYFVFDQYIALDGATGKGAAFDVTATDLNADPTGIGAKNRDVYTGAAYAVLLQRQLMAWKETNAAGTKTDLDTVSAATKSTDALKEAIYALDGYVYPAANHDNPQDFMKAAPWGKLFTSVADDLVVTLDKGKPSASTAWDTTSVTTNAQGDYVVTCKLSDALPVSALKGYAKSGTLNSEELWKLGSSTEEPVASFMTAHSLDHGICGSLSDDEVTGDKMAWNSATKTVTIKKGSGINYLVVGYGVGKLASNGICGIAYNLDELAAATKLTNEIKALDTSDATAVAKARAAYQALSLDARTFVGRTELAKLNAAPTAQLSQPAAPTVKVQSQALGLADVSKGYAASKLSKGKLAKAQTFTVKATGAKTAVTYSRTGSATAKKYVTVSAKTGKVTVKKGTPVGTYTVKVTATAAAGKAGSATYAKAAKTATVKVTVGSQTLKVGSPKAVKASALKKKAQSLKLTAKTSAGKISSVKVTKAVNAKKKAVKGFKAVKASNKQIKLTVPKKLAKGTYTVTVQVKSPKVAKKYASVTLTTTIKVKVK